MRALRSDVDARDKHRGADTWTGPQQFVQRGHGLTMSANHAASARSGLLQMQATAVEWKGYRGAARGT